MSQHALSVHARDLEGTLRCLYRHHLAVRKARPFQVTFLALVLGAGCAWLTWEVALWYFGAEDSLALVIALSVLAGFTLIGAVTGAFLQGRRYPTLADFSARVSLVEVPTRLAQLRRSPPQELLPLCPGLTAFSLIIAVAILVALGATLVLRPAAHRVELQDLILPLLAAAVLFLVVVALGCLRGMLSSCSFPFSPESSADDEDEGGPTAPAQAQIAY
jgi:hypothetical protein